MPSNDKCITRMVKLSSLFHISTALNKNRPLYRVPRVHHSMCTNLSKHQDVSFFNITSVFSLSELMFIY